jgi:hypothetical protein
MRKKFLSRFFRIVTLEKKVALNILPVVEPIFIQNPRGYVMYQA